MRAKLVLPRLLTTLVPMLLVAGCCAMLPKEPEVAPVVAPPPPKIGGIGTLLRQDSLSDGTSVVVVDKVVVGGPADGAGLVRGGIVWTVDGQPVTDVQGAVAALRGPVGTNVAVEVGATQAEKKSVTIGRAEVDSEKMTCTGDCKAGTGTLVDAFGDRYEGAFAEGRYQGQGKLIERSGRTFEGAFVAGNAEGHGILTMTDGSKIEGEFKDGYVVGKGKRALPNGDTYEGEFKQFQPEGAGVYMKAGSADTWTGTFVRGQFVAGAWVHHVESGAVCTRQVADGKVPATGQIQYPVGDKKKRVTFDGAFGDDCVANGEGLMTYAKGKKQGPFLNDEPQKGVKNVK